MNINSDTWNIISYIGNVVGIVSFAVQLTLLLGKNKKNKQVKFFIKSIEDSALTKVRTWNAQLNLSAEDTDVTMQEVRILRKASDEFRELADLASSLTDLASSLEVTRNADKSARNDSLKGALEQRKDVQKINGINIEFEEPPAKNSKLAITSGRLPSSSRRT